MEINNKDDKGEVVKPIQDNQSIDTKYNFQKGYILLIIGIVFLLLVVGVGAYYLGTKNVQPATNNPSQQINGNQNPTSSLSETAMPPTTNGNQKSLKTETLQIKKETAVSGNETINVSLQLPSDWNLQKLFLPYVLVGLQYINHG